MIFVADAEEADIPGIVELWKECADFHGARDPHFARSEDGHVHFEKHLRELMKSEDAHVLVAFDQGRPVAFIAAQVAKRPPVFRETAYGLITDLAVTKECRRQGIGQDIMVEVLYWFARRGIRRVEVNVADTNEVARAFWATESFKDYMHRMFLDTSYIELDDEEDFGEDDPGESNEAQRPET